MLARNAAGTREIARGFGRKDLTLAASGERIGLLTEREIRAGTLTSPFSRLANCASAAVCTSAAGGIAVGDDAIAFQWARSGKLGVDVVNFTPGTTSTRTFAGATGLFALAGRFLAAGNFDQTELDVLDRVTGERIYSVARGGGVFDVQKDGTTVFQASRTKLAYASVAEPFAHQLGFGQAGPGARSDSATVIAEDLKTGSSSPTAVASPWRPSPAPSTTSRSCPACAEGSTSTESALRSPSSRAW